MLTKKERTELAVKNAKYLASTYRKLSEELIQAANVLDSADELHGAYPMVTGTRFAEAIQEGAKLRFVLDELK